MSYKTFVSSVVEETSSPAFPTRSENVIWKVMKPSASFPSSIYQERYGDLDGSVKIVSASKPAIETSMLLKVSLDSKSKTKVSPTMAKDESLAFVD